MKQNTKRTLLGVINLLLSTFFLTLMILNLTSNQSSLQAIFLGYFGGAFLIVGIGMLRPNLKSTLSALSSLTIILIMSLISLWVVLYTKISIHWMILAACFIGIFLYFFNERIIDRLIRNKKITQTESHPLEVTFNQKEVTKETDDEIPVFMETKVQKIGFMNQLDILFYPLADTFPLFHLFVHHQIMQSLVSARTVLKEFLEEANEYSKKTTKEFIDTLFMIFDKNKAMNEPLFDEQVLLNRNLTAYLKRSILELEKEYPGDFHYYRYFGMYLSGKEQMKQLLIANEMLNFADQGVLSAIIELKLQTIQDHVQQLLYDNQGIDADIKELLETVSIVSHIKNPEKKKSYIQRCNDLTMRLSQLKLSKIGK